MRNASVATRNKILSACAHLFLTQGYHKTTVKQIAAESGCATSSFQNLFRSKENVLSEFVGYMFSEQFGAAKKTVETNYPPVYVYALETAVQLAITEINENLRDIYVEAYSLPDTVELIHRKTAEELYHTFGDRFPGFEKSDFYNLDIGSAGLMRGYMAKKCDIFFPLDKKIACFLTMSLTCYRVSPEEITEVLAFIKSIDIKALADNVIKRLFAMLDAKFDLGAPKGNTCKSADVRCKKQTR